MFKFIKDLLGLTPTTIARTPVPNIHSNQLLEADLVIGGLYEFYDSSEDPFERKHYCSTKILDIKSGWVRYRIGPTFSDNRIEISSFLNMYIKYIE